MQEAVEDRPGDHPVGERGATHVKERGLPCKKFPGILDTGRRALAGQVRDYVLSHALAGCLNTSTNVYPRPPRFTESRVALRRPPACTQGLGGNGR